MFTILRIRAAMLLALVAIVLFSGTSHAGPTYRFRVLCERDSHVVEWRTGDIDPGKEYLKVVSGTDHPGCSISGYDAARDGYLRVEVRKGARAVAHGLKPVVVILSAIFGGFKL